ncbi:mitogen-activated protein kinase kinase kinase YODA-like isoform X1 [Canna indica]|uniref:mitogen-activated protein kinase kinase kinase n=1 Tax=Canna indica TaxID=4628 RepID=A0AAQ3Q872_9LILI|nr:mitogen-activated protein kinase kinase kinase YODA-like isoform X1 [Canna indica]
MAKSANFLLGNQILSASPKHDFQNNFQSNVHIPRHGAFGSAPDSSLSSPSRSPMRVVFPEQIPTSALWVTKPHQDLTFVGSGQCSSPGSGQTSGHNSLGGDMLGQLWQHSRGSPECSPIPSPRMTSPGPSSRIHSGTVSPLHPRAGGTAPGSPTSRHDEGKKESHRLPLPPINIPTSSPFSPHNAAANISQPIIRSPGRTENPTSPGSRWKKGKLIGRGTFGHVYAGFNSESGEMCAMKEVTLFMDDAKSKESAKQLGQEICLLSRLRHPNIVQYYGCEMIDDKLYVYLEYVSGGSIHKLLQEYGPLGETAIRSYTQQILSGLAYLHAKNTVHRDIKGANILVDPNGRVKVADFGMAKHITGQSCPLSFKGSPYWMAPEVIKNSSGCNLAVDIWSLGCTVLEMATSKPPWSQYEGIAAMFKIGNSRELPPIPDHLSDDGKDFVRKCLQRDPSKRPMASELLQHPFVKNAALMEKSVPSSEPLQPMGVSNISNNKGVGHARNLSSLDMEGLTFHHLRGGKSTSMLPARYISCPVSPIGSPLLNSRSPQHASGRMSPSPISSPMATSGASTPLTGGNGAVPFNHSKQVVYLHDGLITSSRSINDFYPSGATYHKPKVDLFLGLQQSLPNLGERKTSEAEILSPQIGGRLGQDNMRDSCERHRILSDGKPYQILRDQMKLSQSMLSRNYGN